MKANQTLILLSTSYYDILEQSNKPSEKVEKKVDQLGELIQKAEQARNASTLVFGRSDQNNDPMYGIALGINYHSDLNNLSLESSKDRLLALNEHINEFFNSDPKLPVPNAECNYHIACRNAIEYRLKNEFKRKIIDHKIVK